MTNPNRRVMSATTLIGDPVKNADGEQLGELKEIMLDTETGRIAYGVLSFGGFLGMGDKLFAIPWSALRVHDTDHALVLNVQKEQLEKAPGFDKDKWPDFADRTWGASIYEYYRIKPYW
jgi:sporulation protein YlmC with PRC-barrel domain